LFLKINYPILGITIITPMNANYKCYLYLLKVQIVDYCFQNYSANFEVS
jgi:hypothetical protein